MHWFEKRHLFSTAERQRENINREENIYLYVCKRDHSISVPETKGCGKSEPENENISLPSHHREKTTSKTLQIDSSIIQCNKYL